MSTMTKAGELVQAFLGAPLLMDAAYLGAAAHCVRLFWSNFIDPSILRAALPKLLPSPPPLDSLLNAYHVPKKLGHTDRHPFTM